MSIKDLFDKNQEATQILNSDSVQTAFEEVESKRYVRENIKNKERFIPQYDFDDPTNFARFGLAEEYYDQTFARIYNTYPYDGSRYELEKWHNSSSFIDEYVFDNEYPRTTGYAKFGDNWGDREENVGGYGAPGSSSYEYILIKGGPNKDPSNTKLKDMFPSNDGEANIFNTAQNRESNLKIGGIDGNTVEFWMKKEAFDTSNKTQKEVILDVVTTSSVSSSADYARFTIEMDGGHATGQSLFRVTYMSGTNGVATASLGQGSASVGKSDVVLSTATDNRWHHYAVSVRNFDNSLRMRLYVDGEVNHQIQTGSHIGYVSGALVGTIGALAHRPSGTLRHALNDGVVIDFDHAVDATSDDQSLQPNRGWGKLSASLDEFRYWKQERTHQDIGRNWYTNIYGGANTDLANTQLGVYYKFNEGITGTSSLDSTVLDYSGRTTNGTWVGYSSTNSDSFRSTGSAIDESFLSGSELKDPIIRSSHPEVQDKLISLRKKGRLHDLNNNAAIYHSIPEWITSEDNTHGKNLVKLTQIISSYFDTLALQIKALPQLKSPTYPSSSFKPLPFADKLLDNHGLLTPELFTDATVLQQFAQQDEKRNFNLDLREVKNLIYKNIYNNLSYIYKSKGTEKSFRNLIRCFGIDDEIIKVNIYGDNAFYDIQDNYRHSVTKKNYVNFDTKGTNNAVVYQYFNSNNSNTVSFITSSNDAFSGSAQTLEAEIIFPKPAHHKVSDYKFNEITSSLFGFHTARTDEDDVTWGSPDHDIRVYAIRRDNRDDEVQFKLESDFLVNTSGAIDGNKPYLTSSIFSDIYNDEKWNFAVRIKRNIHPLASGVTSSLTPNESDSISGSIEFYGVNAVQNYIKNSFLVTASISLGQVSDIIESPKRIYVGAHRTNFDGALLQKSNVKASSVRFWLDHLSNETINAHAFDIKNYGTPHPFRNAFLFQGNHMESAPGNHKFDFFATGSRQVPQMETLALDWDFETLTGSDGSGEFVVVDISSGSAESVRYGRTGSVGNYPLSDVLERQHSGRGKFFPSNTSKVVDRVYISNAKQLPPEVIAGSNMIEARTRDDRLLTRSGRPITHFIGIEKSPYQSVTEEMIRLFATLKDFNNLIGEPVNTYRRKYKDMEKIRQLFFERVGNTLDVEKYIDYYKWIDNAVDTIIHQLMPASANTSESLSTIIESHVLERNKFRHKYPMVATVDKNYNPESNTEGGNNTGGDDDSGLFNHSHTDTTPPRLYSSTRATTTLANYPQSPLNVKKGILWWKYRAERDKIDEISSGNDIVDKQREIYRKIISSKVASSGSSFQDGARAKVFSFYSYIEPDFQGGANEFLDKSSNVYSRNSLKPFITTYDTLRVTASNVIASESPALYGFKPRYDFDDEPIPGIQSGKKQRLRFAVQDTIKGTILKDNVAVPFQIYTSSAGRIITNIHNDSYVGREIPLQGPFTEKYVGGLQYRHVQINSGSELDTKYTRPQGFKIISTAIPSSYGNGSDDAKKVIRNLDDSSLINYSSPDLDSNLALDTDLPRAMFYRDETVKRPVNIRNIRSSSYGLGNYKNSYEVVLTNARSINNKFFVDITGAVSSSVINNDFSDLQDFALPERTSYKSVIVNRFSSPGGPEVMSRGFLDTAAEEYSVYNALPYRNLSVRQPYQTLLKRHTAQFGLDSVFGAGSGSAHKVHRNTRYRLELSGDTVITGNVKDNGFITHPIPQSDLQYAWITASAHEVFTGLSGSSTSHAELPFGYEQPNIELGGASNDITFSATSSIKIDGTMGLDYVGLNVIIVDHIDSSQNLLFPGNNADSSMGTNTRTSMNYIDKFPEDIAGKYNIHLMNIHRNGPYGWPSWKQIRTGEHPVARYQRRKNIYNFFENEVTTTSEDVILTKAGPPGYKDLRDLKQYVIPPVTTKFKPIMTEIEASPAITYVYSHANNNNFLLADEGLLDDKENINN